MDRAITRHEADPIDLPELSGRLEDQIARLRASAGEPDRETRGEAWRFLDLFRRPSVLRAIGPEERARWADSICELVRLSDLTVGPLLRRRVEQHGSKALFRFAAGAPAISWREAGARVESIARGLLALEAGDEPSPIALLSENRIESALVDLACLSSGLVNVMIPANATNADVAYILEHSGARTVILSGQHQMDKLLKSATAASRPKRVVTFQPLRGAGEIVHLDGLISRASSTAAETPGQRGEAVRAEDLATVMYTSGTTGKPKGIRFSHLNVVFKRFARALALPEIGEDDTFLCFLPLYHTFGRFLEMLGCVFWGAEYCFLESTSADGLARGMQRCRPTVFISVPKKWTQLHERIAGEADPVTASDEQLLKATRRVTGGRLRWGLSAAGFLDPEIFRFFQRQGVELLSGFGMTEATGGITMTEPGRYLDGSLGRALPGIELRLADDGELLVRGPYVMMGYLDPPDGESSIDSQGWFHTGDVMRMYEDGQIQLIDRKKEIYKNVKGETIAPQRVENLIRELESVGRAFLVGDRREYNTLLIYPNPDYREIDFSSLSKQEIWDHFRSLIVSANHFLAPYERIVDFAVIDRDFDAELGELTPKGTPCRKVVEDHFDEVIGRLYRRTNLQVGGVELTIPNWLFQILGLTARDVRVEGDRVLLPSSATELHVGRRDDGLTRVGSFLYGHGGGPLDLGDLLITPPLWLGNEELVRFVALDAATRQRRPRSRGVEWEGRLAPYRPDDDERKLLESASGRAADLDLLDLDLAARMLAAESPDDALRAVGLIEALLGGEEGPLTEPARMLLARLARSDSQAVRRRAFQALAPTEKDARFEGVLKRFLTSDPELLDERSRTGLREQNLSEPKIDALIRVAHEASTDPDAERAAATGSVLRLLAGYGAAHPVSYRKLRAFLERMRLFGSPPVRKEARRAARELEQGFRRWLGPTARIAVDPETAQEYRWEDVVVFDEGLPDADRARLLSAIKDTALLKEAVFLFSTGTAIRLSDIPPGGVWVRLLGSRHGKSVYRITVQTRFQGSYDVAANVNHELSARRVREEIQWLILSGDPENRDPLVESFGGYWSDQDLWSEEFIAGETLDRVLRRLARQQTGRLEQLWPFLAWATLTAYADFWRRSGKRLEIADPSMTNVVVPTQDYHSGARIVSVSRRRTHRGLLKMMGTFRDELIARAEQEYPVLGGHAGWDIVFSSILEVVGEREGLLLFRQALEGRRPAASDMEPALREFLDDVERRGFVPMRLFFAAERYRRWAALSAEATPQARALTLQELYETYGLGRLTAEYPEIRVRFFLETVFADCPPELTEGLRRIVESLRRGEITPETTIDAVDEMRAGLQLDQEHEYFLARMSYPFLRPEDTAGFVRSDLGGKRQSEIVVTLSDNEGTPFRVRHALNPKEVERLHQLFLAAKLDVAFRTEHRHLVAINERGHIIAGIYYEIDEREDSAHLEKIVAADVHRRKGVAEGLMKEFFNRLKATGVKTVTTGFFRPEYFYAYGFRIEKRYAGLVKSLEEAED